MRKIKILLLLILMVGVNQQSNAQFSGLKKWFNKEVIPTIKGERPLKIDPTRIRVSHNGKDIIRASTKGNGSVYMDFGVAKLQTSNLKKRVAQTAAIFSGNTAVMSQVAYEQLDKELNKQIKKAEEKGEVRVSNNPPKHKVVNEPGTGKEVVIFNHTKSKLSYAMNGNFFTVNPDEGLKHTSADGEFYLQIDDSADETVHIARYYLTGEGYGLYLFTGMTNIGIKKIY